MRAKKLYPGLAALSIMLIISCGSSGGGSDRPPVTGAAPSVPIISDGLSVPGNPPPTSITGPDIIEMNSLPASDVAEAGTTFSLLMLYDSASFPVLDGAILYLEGDSQYFILPVTILPGGLAVASFTISDEFPQGTYTLNFALMDENGVPGAYIGIILHVDQVPSLEIIGLFPLAATLSPENRVYESLNTVGRVVFSRPVTTSEFTLEILDAAGTPVPGILRVLPGNKYASLIPTQLLVPESQYTVTAVLPDEGILISNPFFTEKTIPLGASTGNVVGNVFAFMLDGTNVVEPEAAKMIFGLLGTALPPFLIVLSDIDTMGGTFSAYGGLSNTDPGFLVQDYLAPVLEYAKDAPFQDPYFFIGPSEIFMQANVGGFTLNITFHEFTMSANMAADGSGFTNGAVSLFLDPDELAQVVEDLLGQPIDNLCLDLISMVGLEVCDANGRITARAEGVIGTLVPTIPDLFDLVPDTAAPNTISAAAGDTVTISGTITQNGTPSGAGYNVDIVSTVGTPSPATATTLVDGTFTATLTVAPGAATAGTDIVVTLDAVDFSVGAPDPLQRSISIGVDP